MFDLHNRNSTKKIKTKERYSRRLVLIIYLFTSILIVTVSLLVYAEEKQAVLNSAFHEELSKVSTIHRYVLNTFTNNKLDLLTIAAHPTLNAYLNTPDTPLNGFATELLQLSNLTHIYDQVRYIDENGKERIRVQYKDNASSLVPVDELQSKITRYYFQETIKLNLGEVYASPLDLNIEHGKIEIPYKPMLRFGTPVYDKEGNQRGALILNYTAKKLLHGVDQFNNSRDVKIFLLNKNGYWLKGPNPFDEWGFMFRNGKNKTFKNTFPAEWEKLGTNHSGQILSKNGLFTYETVDPLSNLYSKGQPVTNSSNEWRIISFIPHKALFSISSDLLFDIAIADTFILLILAIGSYFFTKNLSRRFQAEERIKQLNDLLKVINKILRHDMLGRLTRIRFSLEISKYFKKDKDIQLAYSSAKSAVELIHNMKSLEQLATTGSELKKTNIKGVLKEVMRNFTIPIRIIGNADVLADEALRSVFDNIIRNSIMHGKTPRMTIRISSDKNQVRIKLADQGKGVPKKIRELIFEEGFKSGKTGHTGIGLYIVKKTITRYGGEIHVESNKPKGAVFVITLPAI